MSAERLARLLLLRRLMTQRRDAFDALDLATLESLLGRVRDGIRAVEFGGGVP